VAATLTLAQAAYWPQQLSPLQLGYAIDPPLPGTDNVLAFLPAVGAGDPAWQLPFAPTSGTGTFPIPGDDPRVPWSQMPPPGGEYTWRIVLQSAAGEQYASVTLVIVPPPALLSIVYEPARVTAHFVPVALEGVARYRLDVATGGQTLSGETQDAAQNQVQIALQAPLEPGAAFTLSTLGAPPLASTSASSPLLTDLPQLLNAAYDGVRVAAQWTPVPGADEYLMRTYPTGGGPPYENPTPVPQGVLGAPELDESYRFTVMAQAGAVYASTPPMPFVLPIPVLGEAAYDGSLVGARWTAPAGSAITLLAAAPNGPAYQGPASGDQGQLAAPSLDPSLDYTFTVLAALPGRVAGQSTPAPMLLTFPTLLEALYDGAGVTARWQPVDGAQSYTLCVYTPPGGAGPYTQTVATAFGTVAAPALGTASPWYLVVTAEAPGHVSSTLAPATILTRLPTILAGAYDLAAVQARWTPVTSSLLAGFVLRAHASGGPEYSVEIPTPGAQEGTLPIAAPLATELDYTFQVIATVPGGVSSSSSRRMLLQSPTMRALAWEPAATVMRAAWSGDPEPLATEALLELERDGAVVDGAAVPVPDTTWPFARALDDGAVFRARARASDGVMSGPWSAWAAAPVALLVTATFDGFARLRRTRWMLAGATQGYDYTVDDPGNLTAASYTPGGG
jgi:hypothetical protein